MKKRNINERKSFFQLFILALFFVLLCRHFLFLPTTVQGASMSPTLENKSKVIINKVSKINRFDTIVFQAPDSTNTYIKRVIGFPGDQIEMKDDQLYINNKLFNEYYLNNMKEDLMNTDTFTENFFIASVPPNSLFVLGDNRPLSKDSRSFGFITMNAVVGKVQFCFYPWKSLGTL